MRGRLTHRRPGDGSGGSARRCSGSPEPDDARPRSSRSRPKGRCCGGAFRQRRDATLEWCDRSLLARIHRYTLNRLRAEIEPVSAADFMRFLFAWQHVDPSTRLTGLDGLREVLGALDGFELAAGAWERERAAGPRRGLRAVAAGHAVPDGEVAWGRAVGAVCVGRQRPPQLTGATPIALFLREHRDAWQRGDARAEAIRAVAAAGCPRACSTALQQRGRVVPQRPRAECGLDRDALRHAVGALVASGLAASDGFSGLRALLSPDAPAHRARAAGSSPADGPRPASTRIDASRERQVEIQAWALLRRYGVVFRRLLTRETNVAPWRELTRVYRRLEARGEIRGGRFVSGMSGEQFALPDAVERLREIRRTRADGRLITIGTADPLNLAGIITPGERVRTAARNTARLPRRRPDGGAGRRLHPAAVPLDAATRQFDLTS